tara:strand:- start:8810 stop:12283 length:3474 start_codon:yes stop_codon:yes gene_type:complete
MSDINPNFKIVDISSEQRIDIGNADFRDLNKRFGKRGDYIEIYVYSLNNELIKNINLSKSQFKLYAPDIDGLTTDVRIDFEKALRQNNIRSGKYKIKVCVLRPKIFKGRLRKYFNIKEISNSRQEIRAVANSIQNISFDKGVKKFINEIDSAPYFKDFTLKFNNEHIIGINIVLNNLVKKHEILIKLYNPLPSSISLRDSFNVVEEIIDPLFLTIDLKSIKGTTDDSDSVTELLPDFNIDVRTQNSIPSNFTDYDSVLNYTLTSSYQSLLSKLENRDIPEISYDYIRPVSESLLDVDPPSHFENFVHFGSAVERLKNFKYKVELIELYDKQTTELENITGATSASVNILNNKENINTKKTKVIKSFDGYEKFLYYTTGSNSYTWPKETATFPFTLYHTTSSEAEAWLGEEGYGESRQQGQLQSASFYDNTNEYNLLETVPEHIKSQGANSFYVSFINMVGQHFDHLWTHIKHITEVNDTHHKQGISKDLVYYQLKSLGIDVYDQFENADLIEYILGEGSTGSLYYNTPENQIYVTASNAGSIPKGDITKEIWKRLYHNAPYLLKTKGTERGLRALMSCYGIPPTILNVKEFGGNTTLSGPLKDLDTADFYKTFTYEKSSKALKGTSTGSSQFLIKFPWSGSYNNVEANSKTIELRIKPEEQNSGIVLGLDLDASGLQLKLEKSSSGVDILSSGDNKKYGRLSLETGSGNIVASTSYFPIYDGNFWNVHMAGSGTNVYFGAYRSNFLKNIFEYTGSWDSNNYATTFGSGSGQGANHIYAGATNYEGTIQELKSNWGEVLSKTTHKKHALEPFMYSGNHLSSSFTNVLIRLPLGSNDHESLENFPPDDSILLADHAATSSINTSWEEIIEEHYLPTPDTVGKSMTSEKVRIDTGTIDEDILLPNISSETSTLDRQPQDFSDLGIYFSPSTEINEDIIYTLGSFRLDDFIGNPAPTAQTSSFYPDLKIMQDYYFKKVKRRYNYWDYANTIQQLDHTLFKIIEQWVPWKANTKTGLLIEPHYLERNKFAREVPVRSDGQTMTTGLHTHLDGELEPTKNFSLSSSSIISNNNLLTTTDNKGHRKEQGTNGTINIFDNYTDPFLRDANYANNQSSQAPITPYVATKPPGYIAHKSNTLLGNATKGKISSRYYRTYRNGKELDF